MSGKIVNHYGKIVDSSLPVTGVLSIHSIALEWMNDEKCLTCESIIKDIESDESLTDEGKEKELEFIECDSSHTKIHGDWLQDEQGKYYPDESGEFAAIESEFVFQIVYSKFTARGALCSPCFIGQVDLDSDGEFLGYTLPAELLRKDD